jgi:predicted O-methyltransferase YrrM
MKMLSIETQEISQEQYVDILNSCGGRLSINDARILYNTAIEIDAQTIVEIGSMDGCSSMVFGYVCKQTGGHLYCLEPNPKTRWKANMDLLGLSDYATTIMKSSPWIDPKTIPQPIDYLLIDGDHRTRWTIADYHYWEPYVRQGGAIAFHDWTGAKGVGAWVQRAVGIILEDDKDGLEEIARDESSNRGIIVFRKTADFSLSRRWLTW